MTFTVGTDALAGCASWQADCGCIGHGFGDRVEIEVPCDIHA